MAGAEDHEETYTNLAVSTLDEMYQLNFTGTYRDTTVARFKVQVATRLGAASRTPIRPDDVVLMAFGETLEDDGESRHALFFPASDVPQLASLTPRV